jgi:AcrR family transcriptional regulator
VTAKRAYHHPDLRRSLLDAALALVADAGPRGFTLREAARRAGVSHNAPYRHFRDNEELPATVAVEGFEHLAERLHGAMSRARDPLERFPQCGRGYVEFALSAPEHFTVMCDVRETNRASAELASASERVFAALAGVVEECRAAGAIAPADTKSGALFAWVLVHGIAKLAISGRLPWRSRRDILRFTDAIPIGHMPIWVCGLG